MTVPRARVSDIRATGVIITATIFAVFLPALTVPYAFSDDYMFLAMAEHLGLSSPPYAPSIIEASTAEGRPIWGLLVTPVLSAAGTIDHLRFVRILSVLGIVVLALLIRWALMRARVGHMPAALVAVLVCTLPAFQVYGFWTVEFLFPWTAVLAGCASLLAVAAIDAPRSLATDRLVGATVLLLVAVMIYQPPAMFFWVFFAIALVDCVGDERRAWRLARAHFGVAAVALSLGYLGVRLCDLLVSTTTPGASRSTLTHDVLGKASWFVHFGLFESLNLFALGASVLLATFVASVAAGGILLWLRRRATGPLLFVVLGLILIPLTYLPNLVVKESWRYPIFRSQISLSALIALYFSLGALALWVTFKRWLEVRVSRRTVLTSERVALAVAVAFVATSAVLAERNVSTLVVDPQMRELRLLRTQVAALPDHVQKIAFVLSGPSERQTHPVLSDEFGMPSTFPWYTAEPLVLLLLRERGRLAAPHPVVEVLAWYAPTTPRGSSVVNLNGLLRPR